MAAIAPRTVLGCAACALAAYLLRAVGLVLAPPQVQAALCIAMPSSPRRNRISSWFARQNVSYPLHFRDGVLVNKELYATMRRVNLAPDTRGHMGCRLAHMAVLKEIEALRDGWYLVLEDDADGSLSRALAALRFLVPLVPNLQALNLHSPSIVGHPWHGGPLPIFNTRTTAYFVRPSTT